MSDIPLRIGEDHMGSWGIVCQINNVLFSVKKICLILIAAVICFGCSRKSENIPRNETNDDSIASTPESLPVTESFPMVVIEADTSSYYFENQEYYFRAYWSEVSSPPFRFSFYDGFFYMDIPELDDDKIELGEQIKGSI